MSEATTPSEYAQSVIAAASRISERSTGDELLARQKLFSEQIELARHIRSQLLNQDCYMQELDVVINRMREYLDALKVVLKMPEISSTITQSNPTQ